MGCKEIDKDIDGIKYKTVQFPASSGITLTVRITKQFGPIFDAIGSDKDNEIDFKASAFTEKLSAPDFLQLIKDLLCNTYRNGSLITSDTFETDFAGEYVHLYKVLLFVIDSNNFFGKGIISKGLEKLKNLKVSQILPIK